MVSSGLVLKNGLNRYDGYEFKVFNHEPDDSTSISGSEVTTIFEDSRGLFWIGTKDAGLNIFNRRNNTFCKIYAHDSIRLNSIWEIKETPNGAIILGTYPNTVVKIPAFVLEGLDLQSKTEVKLNSINQVSSKDSFTERSIDYHDISIHFGKDGQILLGVSNGLFELEERTLKLKKIDLPFNPYSNEVLCITEDENSNLIISRRMEILIFENDTWESISLERDTKKGYKIRSLFFLNKKLIANGHKLGFEIDLQNKSFREIEGLHNKNITKIFKDESGNIWFGTNGIGLFKHSEFKNVIESHIVDRSIWDFFPFNDSLIWIEVAEKTILYNPFRRKIQLTLPSFDHVRDLVTDHNGQMWLLKRETGGGISIFTMDTKFNPTGKTRLECKSNLHSSLVLDQNKILINGVECELSWFDLDSKSEKNI